MKPTREEFITFMQYRNFSPKTQEAYLQAVIGVSAYYGLPPQDLTQQQIQEYIVYLSTEKKLTFSSCNVVVCGIRCFFNQFLKDERPALVLPPRKSPKQLPVVLSKEEVLALIEAPSNRKHRIILMTVYSAGLRLSEVINLKVGDIDSKRMTIFVRAGKGKKDRYTILSETLLAELRRYYAMYRPSDWLFYSKKPEKPMSKDTVSRIYKNAKRKAGIGKVGGIHTLRHCFATHMIEDRADIRTVQKLMGHSHIGTTTVYLHVTGTLWNKTRSPLDGLTISGDAQTAADPFCGNKDGKEGSNEA